MVSNWKRPETVTFSVWHEFEGRLEKNGMRKKFWVQDVTENEKEDVINYMCSGFIGEEILSVHSNMIEDKQSVEELRKMYQVILSQNAALVCLTKDENGKNKIAGMNITAVLEKNYKDDYNPTAKVWSKIYKIINTVTNYKDVYTSFDGDCYLTAMGLYVLPEFRGEGLGVEILKAREPMCRAFGVKATATVFTSHISQKVAKNAGFQEFSEISYEDIMKSDPSLYIPNISEHTRTCKCMVKLYA